MSAEVGPFPVIAVQGVADGVLVTIEVPRETAERLGLTGTLDGITIPKPPAQLCEQRPDVP